MRLCPLACPCLPPLYYMLYHYTAYHCRYSARVAPLPTQSTLASRPPRISCFLLAAICGIHTPRRPCQFPHRLVHAAAASGGWAMTFDEILDQAIAMLQRRGRLT